MVLLLFENVLLQFFRSGSLGGIYRGRGLHLVWFLRFLACLFSDYLLVFLFFVVVVCGADLLDTKDDDMERADAVLEGEELDEDAELLVLFHLRAKIVRLLLHHRNDLLSVQEVDTHWGDASLVARRNQRP